MNNRIVYPCLLLLVVIILSVIFLYMLAPYFSSILWGIVLAVLFYPVKNSIQNKMKLTDLASTLLILVLIMVLIFLPLFIVGFALVAEVKVLYNQVQSHELQIVSIFSEIYSHVPKWITKILDDYNIRSSGDLQSKIYENLTYFFRYIVDSLLVLSTGVLGACAKTVIMIYLLFFLLKDGKYIGRDLMKKLPFSRRIKWFLGIKLVGTIRATVGGTIIVALIQGALGMAVLYLSGIDDSILLGALIAIFSIVPILGTAIIWIPVSVYLFFTGQVFLGIILTAFFIFILSLVDNFLQPYFIGKKIRIPDYYILLSTLGAIDLYGVNGVLIGPLLVAIC
ncbi:AI-2E family transporter, partial [Citrobacter portucalensis]|uniref:AI-2E family transporter n=1 Tax=Citrobacter portucalensis TaxID=1639133 RepID=UPI00226B09BD